MSVKIVSLSRGKESGKSTIEATFMRDGVITPLKVSAESKPAVYEQINSLLSTEGLDIVEIATELFNLMSPEAKVQEQIKSSFFLSGSLSLRNGKIYFGEERLEDTLATHMLSLLDDSNAPKDEKMWRSYVKFLDNMYQNVNPEIREQLFRWMNYENQSGNAFAITEDGCIIGYKGCQGTVLEPMSKFTGYAIVDGVEYNGHIPNKVGSVVQMPRSAVTHDPSVGCSQGLHVGTRDYATLWAPILLLVKVNPRDVVSVPFECSSQKMRVCEYTVLKVTDASDEHRMYYGSENDVVDGEELTSIEAYDLLGSKIYVECETGEEFTGTVTDVGEDGEVFITLVDSDEEVYEIPLSQVTYWEYVTEYLDDEEFEDNCPCDDFEELFDLAWDALESGETVEVEYGGGKTFSGTVSEVYDVAGKDPGVIIRNEDTSEVKHIKFYRIEGWETSGEDELCPLCEDLGECLVEKSEFKHIFELEIGSVVIVGYTDIQGKLKAVAGKLVDIEKCDMEITIENDAGQKTIVGFESVVSVQLTN